MPVLSDEGLLLACGLTAALNGFADFLVPRAAHAFYFKQVTTLLGRRIPTGSSERRAFRVGQRPLAAQASRQLGGAATVQDSRARLPACLPCVQGTPFNEATMMWTAFGRMVSRCHWQRSEGLLRGGAGGA